MKAIKKIKKILSIKYNIRREFFTVGIPLILSILFMATASVYSGLVKLGPEKQETKNAFSFDSITEGDSLTDEQIMLIMQAKKAAESAAKKKTQNQFDDIVIIGFIIAVTPYSVDLLLTRRRIRQYERDYSDFLFQMSEMMRGGIDPVKATIELSKSDLGSITPFMKKAAALMSYGKSYEYAMRNMAAETKSKLIQRYTDLIIHASYTGGNVGEQVQKSAEDMKRFIALEREKESGLRMYIIIMYMAQGLLLLIAGVFVYNVLPSIQNVNVGMFIKGAKGLPLPKTTVMLYITRIIMINAFFVGLISGKISTGSIKNGLKHSVALIVGSYLITLFVINPAVSELDKINLTPVKYPLQAVGGMPLQDPVVFKATDLKNKSLANLTIGFSIEGPSPGKIVKADLKTDEEGLIRVYVVPGIEAGLYKVKASYNENIGYAEILVKSIDET